MCPIQFLPFYSLSRHTCTMERRLALENKTQKMEKAPFVSVDNQNSPPRLGWTRRSRHLDLAPSSRRRRQLWGSSKSRRRHSLPVSRRRIIIRLGFRVWDRHWKSSHRDSNKTRMVLLHPVLEGSFGAEMSFTKSRTGFGRGRLWMSWKCVNSSLTTTAINN